MNDAAHLRAQKRTSTDPEWLERQAREIEDAIRGDEPKGRSMFRLGPLLLAAMIGLGMIMAIVSYGPARGQSPCGPPALETWDAPRVMMPSIYNNRIEPEAVIVIDGVANRF